MNPPTRAFVEGDVTDCVDPRDVVKDDKTSADAATPTTNETAAPALPGNLSSKEIGQFKDDLTKIVRVAVLSVMIRMLEAKKSAPASSAASDTIDSVIRELKAILGACKRNVFRIDGSDLPREIHAVIGAGAAMDIWLSTGPIDYVNDIDVPGEEFGKLVYAQYILVTRAAMIYWESFKLEFATVYERIRGILGDCVICLKNPENARMTLCWDPEFPTRIVLVSMYRNNQGYFAKKNNTIGPESGDEQQKPKKGRKTNKNKIRFQ